MSVNTGVIGDEKINFHQAYEIVMESISNTVANNFKDIIKSKRKNWVTPLKYTKSNVRMKMYLPTLILFTGAYHFWRSLRKTWIHTLNLSWHPVHFPFLKKRECEKCVNLFSVNYFTLWPMKMGKPTWIIVCTSLTVDFFCTEWSYSQMKHFHVIQK